MKSSFKKQLYIKLHRTGEGGVEKFNKKMLTSFIEALIYGHPLTRLQLLRPIEVLMRLDKP